MSILTHYIHDLANAKIIIFHRQLSINGEAIVYFFKLMTRALGGHAITWQKEKIILIERCFAINIFGYFLNKQCSRAAYFLSYTSYALACGVTNPKYLEDYGKHKLIRYREPPMITSAETIEDKCTNPGQSAEAITQEQEVETQPAEETTTFPRQTRDATIAKESTCSIVPIRKKKSPIKLKRRVPIGRPWDR